MTTFTVELYIQGSPAPVAVMHGCTYISEYGDPFRSPAMYKDGISYGGFRDADGKHIGFTGLSALIREE